TTTQPFIDSLFGAPSVGGDVGVKNYEIQMGDREYVAGGYYVPNAPGTPEIRYPTYQNFNNETRAVNFIHCLLLAYIGPNQYGFDAFNEGIVRAVTMRIARLTQVQTALGLDPELVEQVLVNVYDVEGHYDWYNQRALGGAKFIAPNLRDVPIPDAGSLGGLFWVRYKMAGSAWAKALVEVPGEQFLKTFNEGFYAQPGIANNVPALVALGQSTLNTLRPGDPSIEGLSFAEWFKRQYILETKNTFGPKLLVEPVPVTSSLGGSDFGVFFLQANWFDTATNGDETLLSGTSYPIYWQGNFTFNRDFPTTPDAEKIDIAGGYGSVVPNLSKISGEEPYRASVDVPVQDQIERVYLPVGSIATPSLPTPRDLYGTVVGASTQAGDVLRLTVTVNSSAIPDVPVTNNAFGVLLGTGSFLGNARLTVNVVRNRLGSDTTLLTRRVNKGPGPLALDLRVESEQSFSPAGGLPKGMALIGFPVNPLASVNSDVLGIADNQVLAARFNSSKAKYDLYPELESFKIGHGYFVRLNVAQPGFSVVGRSYKNIEAGVALKPGWNLVCAPLVEVVPTSRIRVVKAADFPQPWSSAIGIDVGTDFFEFTPGPIDPASGAPETGTLTPATDFVPGKAYFVRVLAPEGVTLSFQAASQTGLGPTRSVSGPSLTGWRMSVTMTYGAKQKAAAILGQSTTATRSFDPREDSGMPPGIGGFQVIVEDYEAMYRDVRPLGGGEVFTLHLQGLTPNKVHRLDFKSLFGKVPSLSLRDSKGKSLGTIKPGTAFQYLAKSRNEYIQVVVGGSK
ncbi:MAG: hypothetical protein H7Y17_03220, partial [Chlorobia bacterium]|nr:hypothetical protein [Fimbriimonadaceae bacterium]